MLLMLIGYIIVTPSKKKRDANIYPLRGDGNANTTLQGSEHCHHHGRPLSDVCVGHHMEGEGGCNIILHCLVRLHIRI